MKPQTPLTTSWQYVAVLILAAIVGLCVAIIAVCYLIAAIIKYPGEVGVSFLIACFITAGVGWFNTPYPCEHGDGHTICNDCEREGK